MQYQCTQLMTDYALSEHRQTHIASIENLLHMHIAVITRVWDRQFLNNIEIV